LAGEKIEGDSALEDFSDSDVSFDVIGDGVTFDGWIIDFFFGVVNFVAGDAEVVFFFFLAGDVRLVVGAGLFNVVAMDDWDSALLFARVAEAMREL